MPAKPTPPANRASKSAASPQHTEAPGDLLADQSFAERRDEVDDNAGSATKAPAKTSAKRRKS